MSNIYNKPDKRGIILLTIRIILKKKSLKTDEPAKNNSNPSKRRHFHFYLHKSPNTIVWMIMFRRTSKKSTASVNVNNDHTQNKTCKDVKKNDKLVDLVNSNDGNKECQ